MSTVEPTARRPRRGAELGLVVLALALGIGAYANVCLRINDELPSDFYLQSLALAVLGFGTHVVLRWRLPYADQVILPVAVALNGIGLAAIFRYDESQRVKGLESSLAAGQLTLTALAIVLACVLIILLRDHRALRKLTYTAMIAGLVLVLLPLSPIGTEVNGARIWINVAGFSFQPAEIAKIAFAIFFAGYLVTSRDTLALAGPKVLGLQLPRVRDLGPILLVWAASLLVLVFENDFGTSLLFFGLFVTMLYIATERVSWVVIGMTLLAAGGLFAIATVSHVQQRVEGWLHPFDPAIYEKTPGGSYQLVQGLFSLANGGLFGTGWGNGYPEIVPFSYSDFIYTALGEELGLTGLMAILVLYLILIERGLRSAVGVRDGFGKLLAGGLAFAIAIQVFVVVGGITRIIPLTGLTLPFVAQGGSSVLANWIVVALLLLVSDVARRPSALPVRGQVAAGGIVHHEVPEEIGAPDVAPARPVVVGGRAMVRGATPTDDATQVTEIVQVDLPGTVRPVTAAVPLPPSDDDAVGSDAVEHETSDVTFRSSTAPGAEPAPGVEPAPDPDDGDSVDRDSDEQATQGPDEPGDDEGRNQ